MQGAGTRQEIEPKMDELAREYHDTHDPENPRRDLQISQATRGDGAWKAAGLGLAALSLAPETHALRVDL
jgi:hypothetical protein